MNIVEWHDFFMATASAAAALTGLIFVGVSINITRILSLSKLPERALLSLILLSAILIISILFLIPQQSCLAIGIEIFITAVIVYLIILLMDISIYKKTDPAYQKQYIYHIFINQIALFPYVISGVLILLNKEMAIYWTVPGIIISFGKALMDAWVLLVEINR